jgi:hypothetical protein
LRPCLIAHCISWKAESTNESERDNLCFRGSGYGVRGIEKQKSKQRVERWVQNVFGQEEEREKPTENTKMSI